MSNLTGNQAIKDIDIIVPVFNEYGSLDGFWQRLSALTCFHKCRVIFIDNGSTDGSLEWLRQLDGAYLIEHGCNLGYGASLIDGIQAVTAEQVVIIDADCEYPPEAIPEMLAVLETHEVVYASRLLGKRNHHEAGMPWLKMLGNRIISTCFNRLFDQHCTDLYTGCKAFRRSCVEGLSLQRNGFEHVLEFAVMLSQRGYHIAEIPIDFSPRTTGSSKMSHCAETAKFLFWLLLYRWQQPRSGLS